MKKEIKNSIGRLSCVTAAAVGCVGLVGCQTKAKDVITPLEKGEYNEAVSIYNEAELSDKEKESLIEQLREKLSKIVEEYAADDLIYDDVQSTISAISSMQISELSGDVATASGKITALYKSKEAYKSGLNLFEKKDYEGAIASFEAVVKDDVNYEAATDKIEEAKNAIYNSLKEGMLENVDGFLKNGDYASALNEIEAFDGDEQYNINDNELDKLYNGYVKEYKNLITEKVEKLLEDKNYLTAIKILNDAQAVIDCTEFNELREKVMEEKPVYLCDLKYQTSTRFEVKNEGDVITDTIGNTYSVSNNLYEMSNYQDGWTDEEVGSVEYYVGYAYSKLHGIIAIDDTSSDINSVLTVYGDDAILYTLNLNRKTVPTEIDIDISNINYLKITLSGAVDGTMTVIMSDFTFEK
ncbi:MAG: NPCBM/NEW2 domain-containing protein [Butyrivibrio sp.]